MRELCDTLYRETRDLTDNADRSYGLLDGAMQGILGYDNTQLEKDIQKIRLGISKSKDSLEGITLEGNLISCAADLKTLKKSYAFFSRVLPSPDELDVFVDKTTERYEKTDIGKVVLGVHNKIGGNNLVNGALCFYSLLEGHPILSGVSFISTLAGVSSKYFRDPSFNLAISELGLVSVCSYNAIVGGSFDDGIPFIGPWATDALFRVVNGFVGFGLSSSSLQLIKHLFQQRKFNKVMEGVKSSGIKLDRILRVGLAIKEAESNFGYVSRVCESEHRGVDSFSPQIEELTRRLSLYLKGKTSYDEVIAARIKYVSRPQEVLRRKSVFNVPVETSTKVGYSPEEYEQFVAERKEEIISGKRRKRNKFSSDNGYEDDPLVNTEISFDIRLSDSLQRDCGVNKRLVAGYKISTIVDLTRQKLEAFAGASVNGNGGVNIGSVGRIRLIPEKECWQYLHENIRRKHFLPKDALLYKFQPVGSLRAIFASYSGRLELLDVVNHQEYDKLTTPR
jgi:hypothetical protein